VGLIGPSLGRDWIISTAFWNWASDMVVVAVEGGGSWGWGLARDKMQAARFPLLEERGRRRAAFVLFTTGENAGSRSCEGTFVCVQWNMQRTRESVVRPKKSIHFFSFPNSILSRPWTYTLVIRSPQQKVSLGPCPSESITPLLHQLPPIPTDSLLKYAYGQSGNEPDLSNNRHPLSTLHHHLTTPLHDEHDAQFGAQHVRSRPARAPGDPAQARCPYQRAQGECIHRLCPLALLACKPSGLVSPFSLQSLRL